MMLVSYFVTFVAIFGLTQAASLSDMLTGKEKETDKRAISHHCYVNGRVYQHGEIFTIGAARCIKYRCAYGTHDFVEEGCEAWGQCHPANQHFTYKCRTYYCEAREIGGGFKQYKIEARGEQLCQDYHGQCRSPNELFPFNMNGMVKRQCTCRPAGNSISYICYD